MSTPEEPPRSSPGPVPEEDPGPATGPADEGPPPGPGESVPDAEPTGAVPDAPEPTGEAPEPTGDAAGAAVPAGTDADAEILIDRSTVRRVPVYRRFLVIGALVGVVAAMFVTPFARFGDPDLALDPWGLGLLLAILLAPVGGFLGVAIALLSDRRSRRRRARKETG